LHANVLFLRGVRSLRLIFNELVCLTTRIHFDITNYLERVTPRKSTHLE